MTPGPKPCPFCGHAPVLTRSRQGNFHTYHCDNDECRFQPQAIENTAEEALKTWNIRHKGYTWMASHER
jgi:ssDNA-binding Zn-finger/Zn-ribbon topoisomerase 1